MKAQQEGCGILATISRHKGGVRVVVRSRATRKRIAIVEGSDEFAQRALVALGLLAAPAPVARLAKHGDGSGVAFVGGKPANGDL